MQDVPKVKNKITATKCAHTWRTQRAKGMCQACYKKHFKRTKPPTKCPHTERRLHAKGLCGSCYFKSSYKKKVITKCQHVNMSYYARGMCQNCCLQRLRNERKARMGTKKVEYSCNPIDLREAQRKLFEDMPNRDKYSAKFANKEILLLI